MAGLKAVAAKVLDAFYPCVCVSCHTRIADQKMWICGRCYDNLSFLPAQYCEKCGYPTEAGECSNCAENSYVFTQALSVFMFEDPARSMVHALKYSGLSEIADWFGNQMFKHILAEKQFTEIDLVTAIPLHRVRRRDRGFNQSDLIAKALAKRINKPYSGSVLVRKLNTLSQTILDAKTRRKNIKGAFRIGKTSPAGKSILLIDDVFTTGTTVNEAARVMLDSGAKEVFVMTACHGL